MARIVSLKFFDQLVDICDLQELVGPRLDTRYA